MIRLNRDYELQILIDNEEKVDLVEKGVLDDENN